MKDKEFAFVCKVDSDSNEFVGPFKTYEELMACLNSMWLDDLTGYRIKNYVSFDRDELKYSLGIKIYAIRSLNFSHKDFEKLCDTWEENLKKDSEEAKSRAEAYERKQYEILKKKFEGEELTSAANTAEKEKV